MSAEPKFNVGDRVRIDGRHYEVSQIAVVDRVTATQVVVGGRRFRRDDGREIGGGSSWMTHYIRPATDEDEARWRRHCIADRLRKSPWIDETLEQLEAIVAILDADPRP